jgi:hypothetical protein
MQRSSKADRVVINLLYYYFDPLVSNILQKNTSFEMIE